MGDSSDRKGRLGRGALGLLFVCDSEADTRAIACGLKGSDGVPEWARVDNADDLRGVLARKAWDAVLYCPPARRLSATAALALVKKCDADLPFILVTEAADEELALQAVQSGASDCLAKGQPARLSFTIEREVRGAEARRALRGAAAERDLLAQQRQLALDAAHMGWWHYDPATRISTWDDRYKEIFGVSGHESPNEEILARLHPDDLPRVWAAVEAALNPADPRPYAAEYRVNIPGDGTRWVEARGVAAFEGEGTERHAVSFVGTVLDITDRKSAEERLRESEARYRTLFDEATQGIALADVETGEMLECNRAFAELTGYERAEIIGRPQALLHRTKDVEAGLSRSFVEHRDEKRGAVIANELVTKSGEVRQVEIKANMVDVGGRTVLQGFFQDVTEEQRHHRERETTVRLLRLLNGQSGIRELVHDLTELLREWTGCEAVGVRLQDGDDYPYFETHGFPMEFVELENHLCARNGSGEVVLDNSGNPLLECTCGGILRGRFDTSRPYITPKGSFWTNSTSRLVATLTEAEVPEHARGRCVRFGYESIALIPLGIGGRIIGLLQLNDHAEGRFTPDLIAFLENAADQFAIALAQRQAQKASRESEEHYRSLFANMINGFAYCRMLFDGDGRPDDFVFIEVNAAFEKQTGLKDVQGKRVSEVIPGLREMDPELLEIYGSVALTGIPRRFERFVEAMHLWFDISVYSPAKEHFVAIFEMVTERKQAEERLRKSEERYRALVESAPDAIVVYRDNEILYANEVAVDLCGMGSLAELMTHPILDVVHPEERAGVAERMRRGMQGEYLPRRETRLIKPDGTEVPVETVGRMVDYQGAPAVQVFVHDITGRRQAENELRKLSMAVNQSPASVVITDTRGNMEYVNPKFTEVTGYSRDEVLGGNPRMLKSGETPRQEYAALWRTITEGGEWRGEFHNRKKDGSLFWERAFISPIRDAAGAITHFLGVKEDITQQKIIEEQYRQAQKMEAVGQLAGGVAHDFNNMLQTIMGYGQMLLSELPAQDRCHEFAGEIVEAADRAGGLTRQLLAFSRRQVLEMRDLDLNRVVEDVTKMIKRLIGENIRLSVVPGQRMGTIHADCGQMEQVLINLCVNARDAMPDGGVITVETENVVMDAEYCDTHSWATPGRYVLLSVTDTGCGMDARTQERIFEPFFTTKELGKGTGLGLATVYGIVRQHQGMIQVYSEVGRGTAFKVYLPSFERPASTVGTKVVGRARGGAETILIAEDDEALRRLMERILGQAGYTVLSAANGEEALDLFGRHADDIALCILDVIMPKMSGKAVHDALCQQHPRLRFLFSSGYSTNAIHTGFVLNKDIELIQKPYAPDALLRKVRQILDAPPKAEDCG